MKKFVQENSEYGITADGELWRKGEHGYRAGYVMWPEEEGVLEMAIDSHEEELRVLSAEAEKEFG